MIVDDEDLEPISIFPLVDRVQTILKQIAETYERMGEETPARDAFERVKQAAQAVGVKALSDEEKAVMGYDDAFVNRIAQSYRTLTSLQGSLGSATSAGGGILSYL